ncbi:MAG: hypothetical protein PWP27_1907 [Clostridiales bacterium]|jgi:hypothetical protein|nr:hypothetical protein [Clostridiales bacterium]MDK2934097.1 hypothetical protein [Clostridiales bacterium]
MNNLEKVFREGVTAILPAYEMNVGNVTKIINKEGREYVEKKKVKTILAKLANMYAIDLTSLRRKYSPLIHQRNVIPIPICKNMVLIPFKMRKPIGENDGSLGYIALEDIKTIHKINGSKYIEVITVNNQQIRCMVSYATACKHMKNAQIVKQHYLNMQLKTPSLQSLNDVYLEYDKPATRADIALLASQVMELRNYLTNCVLENINETYKNNK